MDPNGKVALVTGGTRGLGLAIAQRLAKDGARVAVLDSDADAIAALEARDTGWFLARCDVSKSGEVEAATKRCQEELGVIQILVNNAGRIFSAPLVRLSPAGIELHDPSAWESILVANLFTVFYATRAVLPGMIRKRLPGVVVNISSVAARGNPGQTAYSAAKAGVDALTATWAKELAPFRIRVAGVAPGFCDTDATHAAMSDTALDDLLTRVPVRRLGKPEEIAEGVAAVIKNDFFSGKVFELDGGLVL